MAQKYNSRLIFGIDNPFIDYDALAVPVHSGIVKSFLLLQQRARTQGFELTIASGYRSFERQLLIWNEKVSGNRPVYDDAGKQVDLSDLEPWQQVQAILRWSALPGTSRHHWGTDIDVFDRAAVPADYRVQLSQDEVADDGPFGRFHLWLDQQIAKNDAEGFFRPYNEDRGGVSPERWHLSYGPLAAPLQNAFDKNALVSILQQESIMLGDTVIAHLDEIITRYVTIPESMYPS